MRTEEQNAILFYTGLGLILLLTNMIKSETNFNLPYLTED